MAGKVKSDRRNTLTAVIKSLREYIIANRLQPGDRLPTEHELSAKLNVSRNIVREGMRYYRTLGIITSGPRIGAVVGKFIPADPYGGYFSFMVNDPQLVREMTQQRMVLETGAVELMIAGVKDEDLAALNILQSQFVQGRDYREAERMFHARLLQITRNRLIEGMLPLRGGFGAEENTWTEAEIVRTRELHVLMVDALAIRDAVKLRSALRQYFESK